MQKNHTIPKRAEVDPAATWAVEDLFPDEAAWEKAFEEVQDYPQAMQAFRGHLAEGGAALLDYLKTAEMYEKKILRLDGYASLRADEDTADTQAQARKGRLFAWLAQAESETAFALPELLAISDQRLEEEIAEEPELAGYRRYFTQKRRRKAHILSEPEEKLLAAAGEMGDAPQSIYGSLVYADMKFPSVRDMLGNRHELTNASYATLMQSHDEGLRKNTFVQLYEEYEKLQNTFAALLNAQVKQQLFFARARKYGSAREAALDRTEVPVSVYDNLLTAVHDNLEAMYRYVRLRKKRMRREDLHMYDVYVSLVPGSDRVIPFEEAKQDVLAATAVLGEEYSQALAEGFASRWIDVYENQGKRSGAYSSFSQVHPYVLLNYQDNLNSEFTVAHEMGHAMHSYLSHSHQPHVYSSYVIFVAEVASTCNEALLMQYLLQKTEDKKERAVLLNYFLEQFRTTVYRQAMFAEFEKIIYEKAEQGETLTADVLSGEYRRLNEVYYGPDMVIDDEIAMEWARIPHFYYNFYVYQYATGFAAAIALSQRILREGEPAVQDYLAFLSGGCSEDPISLLRRAGVDMTTPEPVQQALAWFGELVDELAALLEELR
ncbi:MAG: oligoendopeptidase F [Lachnospiraceae bacterium]|nr:oligoendopeptidase F [Lachnospiraceae bacterium]